MHLFDPVECKAAQDYLKGNQPIEAARILLESKNRNHRAVRRLLVDVGRQLIDVAKRQVEAEQWEAAWSTLQLAGRCIALDEQGLALLRRVERVRAEQQAQEEDRARRRAKWLEKVAAVQALVKQGDFTSALQILEQLKNAEGLAEVTEKITEIEHLRERFLRYVEECRSAMGIPDAGLARQHWERAKDLCPEAPQIKRLAAELARVAAGAGADGVRAIPVRNRSQRLVLDEIAPVILAEEIAIGSPRGEDVQLPVLGRIHGRHAVVVRDRHGWQIMACRNKYGEPCSVLVDGQPVDGVARLANGSIVELDDTSCRWVFRLPVAGSFTALWEALPGHDGSIVCPRGRTSKRAIFMADELVIGASAPAHLTWDGLPCQRVVLRWHDGALHWSIEGGSAWMEIPGLTWYQQDTQVYLPSRLTVEGKLSEAERLGRAFMGTDSGERMTFAFLPWSA